MEEGVSAAYWHQPYTISYEMSSLLWCCIYLTVDNCQHAELMLMCRTILTTHCHISTFNKHWSSCSTVSSSPLEIMSLVLSVFSPVYHTVSAHCSAQTELRSGYWHRNTSAGASQLTPDHETMVTWCSSEAVTHQPCSPLNMTTWLMSPISPGHHQLHSFILVSSAPGNVEQFRIQNIINRLSI